MTAESGRRISLGFWLAMAGLLAAPIMAPAATAAPQGDQERQEREQERLDREQEKRDHAQELRDREQEKRDREQERADRQTELYDDGQEALDEGRWEQAEAKFGQLAEMNGPQSGAAKDAKALDIEVRQSSGQQLHPEAQGDDELRLLAIQGLMNSDPERALPLLKKVLEGPGSRRVKDRALFVLAQNGSPAARQALGEIARGQNNPELQRKAVQYLGLFGGEESRKTLEEVYASTAE